MNSFVMHISSMARKGLLHGGIRKRGMLWLALLTILVVLSPRGWGQDNATITGTVTDSSGALLPGAEIQVKNEATGQIRKTTSNSAGIYRFPNVGIGNYTLTVTVSGFQVYTKTDIVVNVAQTVSADVKMQIGSAAQTVTVQADALQVQSESSEVSSLISGEQVTQLATNGRNVTQLAALGMGKSNTLSDFSGVNALTSSNAISFNGTRPSHNIYMVDGGELNDRGCGGCFSSLPSMDAMGEFQTLDSNYGPDYGIGSGGTVLMVIKSGTRQFHGEAWEFNRNEAYGANNYLLKQAGQAKPKFRLNEPGFNLGGPLFIPGIYNKAHDRTFFFVNEEWRKLVQGAVPTTYTAIAANNFPTAGQPLVYTVPSNGKVPVVPATSDPAKLALYAADGLVAGQPFPNNTIPANLMDSNAVLMMNSNTFPKPNSGNNYIASPAQPTNVREDLVRIDHTINSKFQLMGHYLHDDMSQTYYPPLWANSAVYPAVGSSMKNPSYSSVIKLTQTYSPSLLNETAFNYSGNIIHLDPIGNYAKPSGWTATSFFPDANNRLNRMPEVQLGSPYSQTWSESYFPWKNSYEGYQGRDDLSWTRGRHQFKFGFGYFHTVKNQELQANTQGTAIFSNSTFSGDSYINFLLGMADSFTQLDYLAGKHWVNNNYSFYLNDNWHASSRLTLNLGYRYDAMPHAYERYDKFANFVPSDYDPNQAATFNADNSLNSSGPGFSAYNGKAFYLNGIRLAGVNGFPRGNVHNFYGTHQPRVGFALDMFGDGRTILRGGAGIFFERVQGNDVYNAALNPPFAFQPSATNVYFSNPKMSAVDGSVSSGGSLFPSNLTNLDYSFRSPGTGMFSLGVQRELAPSIVGVVQYVGTLGWHQSLDRSINTLPLYSRNPAINGYNGYGDRRGVAKGTLNANRYRQFLGFSTVTQEENTSNSSYNSLQMGVRVEKKHGLTTQVAYTYSHEIDVVSYDLNSVGNPFNINYNRGSGGLDRRHILNISYIYSLPFFAHSPNGFTRSALGGWELSGVVVAQSGIPLVNLTYNGTDTLGLGGGTTNRPNVTGKIRYPKTAAAWFDTSALSAPIAPWDSGGATTGFGNARKDAIVGPGRLNFNTSLFKSFALGFSERSRLELRFESFNTFNHTQFNDVDAGSNDANFGKVKTVWDPRNMQLAGKIIF